VSAPGLVSTPGISAGIKPPAGVLYGVTNGSAILSGEIGETITAKVAVGSAVTLTTATAANVTSIVLTPGKWSVLGNVNFQLTSATTAGTSAWTVGVNTGSATLPVDGTEIQDGGWVLTTTSTLLGDSIPSKPYNINASTTVYLVALGTFSAGTVKAYGSIVATRIG
jgi:hypothetical protein